MKFLPKSLHLTLLGLALVAGWAAAQETEPDPLSQKGAELIERLTRDRAEIAQLKAEVERASGEDLRIAAKRLRDRQLEMLRLIDELVDNVVTREEDGGEVPEERSFAEAILETALPRISAAVDATRDQLEALRSARDTASTGELVDLEWRISHEEQNLDTFYEVLIDAADWMDRMGLDSSVARSYLSERLVLRAEKLSARIELSIDEAAALRARVTEEPDNADLGARLRAVETKVQNASAHLDRNVELMKRLELESARYRALLIRTTGQVTSDVLSTDVALGLVGTGLQRARDSLVERGPGLLFNLVVFFLILLVFRVIAGLVRRIAIRGLDSSKLNVTQLLRTMILRFAYNLVLVIGLLVALSQLGVSLGPLLAGLGVIGFIVGFALQDTLGNFASGMMILLYRPFDVGDIVEAAGISGAVEGMSLVSTTILTFDHQTIVVPNNRIWGDVIKNVTAQEKRRIDMIFGIDYSDDVAKAEAALREILSAHDKVLDDPEPMVRLHTLAESSVDFAVRPWVLTEDYWDVYWDITREVKLRFDREGISIPFPQRDVHIYRTETS